MSLKVAVIGASGFIGRRLATALRARGDTVETASLRDLDAAARACGDADAIVNLAGAPVATRWTAAHKREIERTRIDLPRALLERLGNAQRRARAYISASAVGYYGTSETATFVESSRPGDDFLARVCVGWETVAQRAGEFGMRVACVRTGIVLGADGGALKPLLVPFRLGLGGVVGSGRQWMSWIHIEDQVHLYLHVLDRAVASEGGAYDATAPNPVTNREFTAALGKALHRPAFLPVPAIAMKALFGQGATIVLDGQRVLPERTLATGFTFRYPTLEGALRELFG